MDQSPSPPFLRRPDGGLAQCIEFIEHIDGLPCPVPLAYPVLFRKADSDFAGQGSGNMMKGTEQHSARDAKRLGNEGVSSVDGRQIVDGCARILRIMLLARQSSSYSSAKRDVRGILLDAYC